MREREAGNDNHEEDREQPDGRKSRRTSLPAKRCETKVLSDWRGETLVEVRPLIRQADPDVVEEAAAALNTEF